MNPRSLDKEINFYLRMEDKSYFSYIRRYGKKYDYCPADFKSAFPFQTRSCAEKHAFAINNGVPLYGKLFMSPIKVVEIVEIETVKHIISRTVYTG